MLLGIGYAALTDVLDINGTADVTNNAANNEFDQDIYFSAAVANEGAPNTASVNGNNNDKADFTVKSLALKGDKATFTFTIKNDGELPAVVTPQLTALNATTEEYFTISSDWAGQPKVLAANSSITYTLTIELIKTPTDSVAGTFHVELTAVADNAVVNACEHTYAAGVCTKCGNAEPAQD